MDIGVGMDMYIHINTNIEIEVEIDEGKDKRWQRHRKQQVTKIKKKSIQMTIHAFKYICINICMYMYESKN